MHMSETNGVQPDAPTDEATSAFLVASRVLLGVVASSLADLDYVTLPQFRVLVLLSNDGPETVGALAAALEIHPSTATRMCDRLVRKGLVRRTRARTDRRATDVALTAAGRRTVEQVTERRRRAIAGVLERMAAPDREAAIGALAAFATAAGEPSPPDPFGWASEVGAASSSRRRELGLAR